jgi:Zn-finger protein
MENKVGGSLYKAKDKSLFFPTHLINQERQFCFCQNLSPKTTHPRNIGILLEIQSLQLELASI